MLDLCTGTADLAVATVRGCPARTVVGVDFAGEMLRLGLDEDARRSACHPDPAGSRRRGHGSRCADRSCDGATVAFGIRNVAEPARALAELARVLRPGGRLAILEFGQPRIPGIRTLLRLVFPLPVAAGRPDGFETPERLLVPAGVGRDVPAAGEFLQMCESSGFTQVRAVPLTFGIVYLYVAERTA